MVDPITDLLNRIRNAGMAQHVSCRVPHSNIKARILEIMRDEGFIDGFSEDKGDGIHRDLVVYLRFIDDSRIAINSMRRVSKPGRRWYSRAQEIARVKDGLGVAIISTSKGVMSDRDARRLNVGGEVLCEVW
jgi:small subunit ribosomal protein S8